MRPPPVAEHPRPNSPPLGKPSHSREMVIGTRTWAPSAPPTPARTPAPRGSSRRTPIPISMRPGRVLVAGNALRGSSGVFRRHRPPRQRKGRRIDAERPHAVVRTEGVHLGAIPVPAADDVIRDLNDGGRESMPTKSTPANSFAAQRSTSVAQSWPDRQSWPVVRPRPETSSGRRLSIALHHVRFRCSFRRNQEW